MGIFSFFGSKKLSEEQLKQLATEGYTVLPNAVPKELRDRALRTINNYLATADMSDAGRHNEYLKPLTTAEPILDLYHKSDIPGYASSLIGSKRIEKVWRAQMALRFPEPLDVSTHIQQDWHVDNCVKSNGEDFDWEYSNFTLLAGVYLSDVSTPGRGNFTVRPGGHLHMAEHFRKYGIEGIKTAHKEVELAPPKELCLSPGDVAFVHHLLPHTGGVNTSPDIRYTCYFRLYTESRGTWLPEAMSDPFREWEGMPREIVESGGW